ncbi:MAG: hypothetical protein ACREP5_04450, partial [Candidatus Binatia bacterium]
EVGVEDGRVTTLSLGDYKIPNVRDVPMRQTTLVEGATQGPGPFNAKPAAEHAITPIPPAVGNAVFNATGIRLTAAAALGGNAQRSVARAQRRQDPKIVIRSLNMRLFSLGGTVGFARTTCGGFFDSDN